MVQKYPQLFEESLGTLKGATAKIYINPTVTPIFHNARPVPFFFEREDQARPG